MNTKAMCQSLRRALEEELAMETMKYCAWANSGLGLRSGFRVKGSEIQGCRA